MTKSKFSEHQIISILKQTENGRTVAEVCREHSIYFKWKTKYGGMEASDLKRIRDLEDENRQLKRMFADLSLENRALKDVIGKKALEPVAKKAVVLHLQVEHRMSERRACRLVNLSRSVFRYAAHGRDDSEVQTALTELVAKHPEFGFRKMFLTLRRLGHLWNHKRVYRIYCGLKLNKRRKHKRHVPARNPLPLAVPEAVNQVCSADFMSDALWNGKRFRTFNVIDDFNREALAVEIDTGISAHRVVRILDQIAVWRGLPSRIRFDNGPELTALAVADWAEENGIELEFIKPGRPMQNGFIERFNRSYREAVLNMYIFETLDDVKTETEKWLGIYNWHRPHDSLGNLTPIEYLQKFSPETVI